MFPIAVARVGVLTVVRLSVCTPVVTPTPGAPSPRTGVGMCR